MTKPHETRKCLRSGFTTGTAAAAAARAAAMAVLGTDVPKALAMLLPNGETWRIPVSECRTKEPGSAECLVEKDAGDDPDVTNGAVIGARVRRLPEEEGIRLEGGEGVGRVTKPGLEVPVGSPAINPVPRQMITGAVREAAREAGVRSGFHVEVFVPKGEIIAQRTMNARLGIEGGISILGTTGVVTPLSHEAYIATIRSGFRVARAAGLSTVVCTTGRRSERHAQAAFDGLPEEAFVQIGDFFAESLETAGKEGFSSVLLAAFFGKVLKMAQGARHTHAARSRLHLPVLGRWIFKAGGSVSLSERVACANTAREAFLMLSDAFPESLHQTVQRARETAERFSPETLRVRVILFDYNGRVFSDTGEAA